MKVYALEMQDPSDSWEWSILSIDTNWKRIRDIADRIMHTDYRITFFEKGKKIDRKYYVWEEMLEMHEEWESEERYIFDI